MPFRENSHRLRLLEAAAPPVGVFPGKAWTDSEVVLTEQDLLFLYTDGIVEARRNGDFFGQDRLVEAIQRSADPSPARLPTEVLEEVLAFSDGVLRDDVALLALRLRK